MSQYSRSLVRCLVSGISATLAFASLANASSAVPVPAAPSGPAALVEGQSSYYLAGGVSCEPGVSPEYQFDWGDGALSEWRRPAGRNPAAAAGAPTRAPLAPAAGAIAADLDRLRPLVKERGRLRLIVSLKEPVEPEASLRPSEARSQQARIAMAQEALLSDLRGDGVRELRRFRMRPAVALAVDEAGLDALGRDPRVARLHEDRVLRPALRESVPAIGAPAAWSAGATGQGQAVAILDTGIDRDHPMLAGRVVAEACYSSNGWYGGYDGWDYESWPTISVCPSGGTSDAGPGSAVPSSDHGTYVAAIAAGSGDDIAGVAPSAAIVSVQVSSQSFLGDGVVAYTSDVIAGMEHVLALSRALPIAAANLSFAMGSWWDPFCEDVGDPLALAIADLRAAGIATVAAAGDIWDNVSVSYPACFPDAIAVGSTTLDDALSWFTGAGPELDLLAPGEPILSAARGGGLVELSGTSAAAPHVAGAWAVLRSWNPSTSVEEILSALATTGVPIQDLRPGSPAVGIYPRIQVDRALAALPAGEPLTTVGDVVEYHTWGGEGYFAVRARARCSGTPGTFSDWSDPLGVEVAVRDQLGTPRLSGPDAGWANSPVTILVTGSGSPAGRDFGYVFDWGDGSREIIAVDSGTVSNTHSYKRRGDFAIRVAAWLRDPATIPSDWSEPLHISIDLRDVPDLTGSIVKLTGRCAPVEKGGQCTATVRLRVENRGDARSMPTTAFVRSSRDAVLSAADEFVRSVRLKPLGPGGARVIEFKAKWTPQAGGGAGSPQLLIELDAPNFLQEYDETNNVVRGTW